MPAFTIVGTVNANGVVPYQAEIAEIINRSLCVGCFHSVIGKSVFAANRHNGFWHVLIHPEKRKIEQMYPPVGHHTACIIPEPAKRGVKPVFIERPFRSRPEPHVVVYSFGSLCVLNNGNRCFPAYVRPRADRTHPSDIPLLNILHRVAPMRMTPLPLAYLHHIPVPFLSCNHHITFFNGRANRLFNIDILPGLGGIHHRQTMPVIRSPYNYRIDILIFDQLTKIAIHQGFFPGQLFHLIRPGFKNAFIHITERDALHIFIL